MNQISLPPLVNPSSSTEIASTVAWLRKRLTQQAQLSADSRRLANGDGFFAYVAGNTQQHSDGRPYIDAAFAAGAQAVLYEADDGYTPTFDHQKHTLGVKKLGWHAGEIASAWYGLPSQSLSVIGVTGTNGKTSCALWLAQALEHIGQHCGVIGTLGAGRPGNLQATGFTTPDAVQLQRIYQQLLAQGVKAIALEVSSHGLEQGRVNGTAFTTAIFTNLSRDHLDYHGTMHAYQLAKSRLFMWRGLRHAVINIDDPVGESILQTIGSEVDIFAYGIGDRVQKSPYNCLSANDITPTAQGTSFAVTARIANKLYSSVVDSAVIGRFNISNLLAVLGGLLAQGVPWTEAVSALAILRPVPGRMQQLGGRRAPLVVVDYAHTPDALQHTLATLRTITQARTGRLWCIFGCGGDRDPGKRVQMGQVSEQSADHIVLTNDNPRTEHADLIIEMIKSGMHAPQKAHVVTDRAAAILYSVRHAQPQDVILVAGKGHETWQEINGKKIPFSDAEHVHLALAAIGANS